MGPATFSSHLLNVDENSSISLLDSYKLENINPGAF